MDAIVFIYNRPGYSAHAHECRNALSIDNLVFTVPEPPITLCRGSRRNIISTTILAN